MCNIITNIIYINNKEQYYKTKQYIYINSIHTYINILNTHNNNNPQPPYCTYLIINPLTGSKTNNKH